MRRLREPANHSVGVTSAYLKSSVFISLPCCTILKTAVLFAHLFGTFENVRTVSLFSLREHPDFAAIVSSEKRRERSDNRKYVCSRRLVFVRTEKKIGLYFVRKFIRANISIIKVPPC